MAKVTVEIHLRIMDTIGIDGEQIKRSIEYDHTEEGRRRFADGVKDLLNCDHVEVTGVKHFVLNGKG